MVRIYSIVLFLAVIVLALGVAYVVSKANGRMTKLSVSIIQMFTVAIVTCLAYMTAISVKDISISEWAYAVFFASIDWLLISMFFYARQYTKIWEETSLVVFLYAIVGFIDNICIFANSVHQHAFSLKWEQFGEGDGCFLFITNDYFIAHLAYCYILVVLILCIFLVKAIRTGGFHRSKYLTVFVIILAVVIIEIFCIFIHWQLDISVGLYAIVAIAIGYFSATHNSRSFAEYMLGTIAERMDCALIVFDENDNCVYINQLAGRIFGISNTRLLVEDFFLRWKDGRENNAIQNTCWNDVYEVNGEECNFDIHFNKIYDKRGHYSGCYFSFYDITSDVVAYEEEKYRANHDSLTGAYNREGFYEEVRGILSLYPTTEYVMVCSNIKGFKLINDMFGLDIADRILVKISDVIRARIKSGSAFARLEADRFAVLMPKERYTEELFYTGMREVEYVLNNSQYRMNILVGVYDIADRSVSVATMCDRAFLAIESVKDSYNSTIAYYGDMLRHEYMNEQKIIGEFEDALTKGQFALFLQPIVSADRECHFAEALVRWIHPEKGIIPPAGFISVLENTGYIFKLDLFVWEQACKKLAYWKASGRGDMSISVNISVKDFYYTDIYETMTSLVEKYGISPENIKLEITESVFMTEKERQLDIIYALRDYGFTVEIDDFGSGYSSLNMLKEVPANVLKIDMGFLDAPEGNDKGNTIVSAVVRLAKALDMKVIVEGVEEEEQFTFLKEAGCDLFQGYYFDKPLSIKSFEEKYM